MRRARYDIFSNTRGPCYIVQQDMFQRVVVCRQLASGADVRTEFAAAVAQLEASGWQAESGIEWGFVFLSCGAERALLLLTERDPASNTPQSFNPHRSA